MLALATPFRACRAGAEPRAATHRTAMHLASNQRQGRWVLPARASTEQALGSTGRPAKKQELPLGVAGALGLGLLAATVMNTSVAQADADLALGQQVFEGNCAACHAGGGNVIIADHTLAKDAIEKYLDGGYNITAITYQVTNGKGAMPSFAGTLDEDEIDSVAQYVYQQAAKGW